MARDVKQSEKSLPGKVVRGSSKAVTGGAAIMLALLMLMFFRMGGGLGTGDAGDGSDDGSTTKSAEPGQTENRNPPLASAASRPAGTTGKGIVDDSTRSAGLTDDEKKALSGEVLTVLIDEYTWLIEIPSENQPIYRPTELARIVELAGHAQGDSNGIRVRIVRRKSARFSAEEQLKNELAHKGIGSNAIHAVDGWIP